MTLQWIEYALLLAVVSYCCGNVNGSILMSRQKYGSDVRQHGSGNAGLSNFYRCYGKAFVAYVILIDMVKAVAATLVGGLLFHSLGYAILGKALGFLFVIVGHMFPVTYDFQGGKGVLSTAGALLAIDWRLMLALVLLYVVTLLIFRFSSLASIVTVFLMPFGIWLCTGDLIVTGIAALTAALIIYMHRGNISRLIRREEPRVRFNK